MKQQITPNQYIAAIATLLIAALICLLLFIVDIATTTSAPQKESPKPQLAALDEEEEEEFVEPIIEDPGTTDAIEEPTEEASAAPLGEPEKAPEPSTRVSTSGPKEKPNTSSEHLVSQKKESPVQTVTPSKKNTPDSKIASEVGGKFSAHNGTSTGSAVGTSGSASEGAGVSTSGTMGNGRAMLSCPKPSLRLSKKTTVKIQVIVNSEGKTLSATCSTPGVENTLKQKLIAAAKQSTWTPLKGAPDASGTITFTIVPAVK